MEEHLRHKGMDDGSIRRLGEILTIIERAAKTGMALELVPSDEAILLKSRAIMDEIYPPIAEFLTVASTEGEGFPKLNCEFNFNVMTTMGIPIDISVH